MLIREIGGLSQFEPRMDTDSHGWVRERGGWWKENEQQVLLTIAALQARDSDLGITPHRRGRADAEP